MPMFSRKPLPVAVWGFLCLFMLGFSLRERPPDSDSSDWQVIGQYGGPTQGVAVRDGMVYTGIGPRLTVLDATDPDVMHPLGGTGLFGDFVKGVAVSGKLAFVAAGGAGLRVVDIGDPARPMEIGAWDSPGYASGIAVDGNTAYLADGPFGLAVVDVSDPTQPRPTGSAYAMEYAYGVAFIGRQVYVAAGSAGMLSVDATDPEHPMESGAVDTAGFAYGVAAAGARAYVADGWNGLQVVDVADPTEPVLGGLLATSGWAFGVTLSGADAYVADAQAGLLIVDVSDPDEPGLIGAFDPGPGHAGNIAVEGQTAFVADRDGGVRVVDVSRPAAPVELSVYSPLGNAVRVVADGRYAYVAAGTLGVKLLDIADPSLPRETGGYDPDGFVLGVQVVGDYAYLADSFNQEGGCWMHVVDVSDPADPVPAADYLSPYPDSAYRDIEVADGVAYLVDETSLQVIDVTDPKHPSALSRLRLMDADGEEAVGVSVRGNIVYVASSFAGLKTVDVSDPENPVLLGRSTTEWSFAQDVFVDGDTAYMAEYNILRTVDISDPGHPRTLGLVSVPGELYDVKVEGDTAFLAVSGRGLETADVSNPAEPVLTGGFNTAGIAHGVAVGGGNVFLADGQNGLVILARALGGGTAAADRGMFPGLSVHARPAFDPIPGGLTRAEYTSSVRSKEPEFTAPGTAESVFGSGAAAASKKCTVTSAADDGPGTLRNCLDQADGGAVIDFSPETFPPAHPATIRLLSRLPHFPGNTTLDASDAGVILDGEGLAEGDFGLSLTSDGNIVRGLQLTGFPSAPILVMGKNNIVGGDRAKGAGPTGQGNLISGNRDFGIFVAGPDASGNLIAGNLIGTDATGTRAWGNGNMGVFLHGGAHDNTVGGPEEWMRNIVSDNYYAGVGLMSEGTSRNLVIGNYLGTDITGTKALGNRGNGVTMELAASSNIVRGNLSSGNSDVGVCISDQGSNYNVVVGNLLGTDASGTRAIPNQGGVRAGYGGASFNRIGGFGPGEGNLISGNRMGVGVTGSGAVGNLVLGNRIGTDGSGNEALGNSGEGLVVSAGETVVEGNVVAGNGGPGILLDSGSTPGFVLGNWVGLNPGGVPLGNEGNGIEILRSDFNFLQDNTAAFNRANGIQVTEGLRDTIRRNSVYSNGGGIVLAEGGNAEPAAPVLAVDPLRGVTGTVCPGCTVELFADEDGQGRYFLDGRTADASGAFAFRLPCLPEGLSITATVTDRDGNTSAFSKPVSELWTCGTLDLWAP
jgi:hypothetical protein